DNLPHELAATRLKEKQLRFRGHTRIVRSKLQKFTNGFADRRAARFAGDQMWHPGTLQSRGQSLHLRRFSTALCSFKRDEWQPGHDVDCETSICDCRIRAVGGVSSASPSPSGVAGAPPSSTAGKFAPHKLIGLVFGI